MHVLAPLLIELFCCSAVGALHLSWLSVLYPFSPLSRSDFLHGRGFAGHSPLGISRGLDSEFKMRQEKSTAPPWKTNGLCQASEAPSVVSRKK